MKIWIDLTDFLNWRGNLTGIQRIQYNISKQYIEQEKNTHFFVYEENQHNFHEVNFNPDEIVKAGIVLEKSIKAIDSKLVANVKKHINKYISKKRNEIKENSESIFNKDDIVLIMGGMWIGDYMDDLEKSKEKDEFKLVHFMFDMIPSFSPGYVVDWLPETFTNYNKKMFSIVDGILAISESTIHDVKTFMKIHSISNRPKIEFVRIGEGINTGNGAEECSLDIKPGFILSVSTVEGRKNHAALFYVVKEAKARGIKLPKVIIVGRDGWLTDDIRYIIKHDPDAMDGILLLNDVNDGQLAWLYRNCLFTIFPSFYEGWGMPVAESLSYGKLCLSSNTSSMPEIAGDLIDYFSPYDTGAMLDCIVKYLDKTNRDKKEVAIKNKYRQTSWLDMYNTVSSFVDKV